MRRTAFFLALFVVMVNTLGECSDGKNSREENTPDARTELDQLQGEWVLTVFEVRKENAPSNAIPPEEYSAALVVEGDVARLSLVLQNEDFEYSYRFTLGTTKSPKHLDAIITEGVLKDIYEINGDTLRLFSTERVGTRRPASFKDKNGNYYVWKRKVPRKPADRSDLSSDGCQSRIGDETCGKKDVKNPCEGPGAMRNRVAKGLRNTHLSLRTNRSECRAHPRRTPTQRGSQ